MDKRRRFDREIMPHLDAGYNLARWLLRDAAYADDVLQDAALRAFRFLDNRRNEDAKPWFLGIVRNACMDLLRRNRFHGSMLDIDDDSAIPAYASALVSDDSPETLALRECSCEQVDAAIADLPPLFREVLVLREMEELSYEEIAAITGLPPGTVMSRLSRARSMLRKVLTSMLKEEMYERIS
jgi:RNA polymerase sigma factor (sigma-70 family)